jgi:hypothetical protein
MEERKTQKAPEDRTSTLRAMLKYEMKQSDLVPAMREVSRLIIEIHDVLASLPDLRASVASTQALVINFVNDQLKERRDRESRELEIAELSAEKARSKLGNTEERIRTIKFPIKPEVLPVPAPTPTSRAEEAWIWFRDKVLPYLVIAMVVIIGQAIWAYIKVQLNVP